MKPEELLLKDLAARLPYDIMCKTNNSDRPHRLKGIIKHHKLWWFEFDGFRSLDCKPYLRSMSSMTEEERAERIEILWELEGHITEDVAYKYLDWLNENMFDYRGLIEKGLALAAPKGMYK